MMRAPGPRALRSASAALRHQEHAGEIDRDHPRPQLGIGLVERRARRLAGIVHQDVDRPELAAGRAEAALDRRLHRSRRSHRSTCACGADRARHLFQRSAPPSGQRQRCARAPRARWRWRRRCRCRRRSPARAGRQRARAARHFATGCAAARARLVSYCVLADQVLLGPGDVGEADLRRLVQRPGRIGEMRARDRAQIGAAGGDDRIGVVGLGDRADRDGRNPDLVADLVGERRLEQAAVDRLLVLRRPGRTSSRSGRRRPP